MVRVQENITGEGKGLKVHTVWQQNRNLTDENFLQFLQSSCWLFSLLEVQPSSPCTHLNMKNVEASFAVFDGNRAFCEKIFRMTDW